MDKGDLINTIRMIKRSEGTEKELDDMLNNLKNSIMYPNISDLIFFSEKTPEEIAETVLAYKPIVL